MELEIEVDTKDSLVQKVSPINGTASKRCKGECGLVKPLSAFHTHHMAHDGHVGICKTCQKKMWNRKASAKHAIPVNPLPVHPTQAPEYLSAQKPPTKSLFTLLQMVIEELTQEERTKLVAMLAAYDKETL